MVNNDGLRVCADLAAVLGSKNCRGGARTRNCRLLWKFGMNFIAIFLWLQAFMFYRGLGGV